MRVASVDKVEGRTIRALPQGEGIKGEGCLPKNPLTPPTLSRQGAVLRSLLSGLKGRFSQPGREAWVSRRSHFPPA